MVRACKIGHRANFRTKYKCFLQILFPVRAILRSINFRCADFNTDSADACILGFSYTEFEESCLYPSTRCNNNNNNNLFIYSALFNMLGDQKRITTINNLKTINTNIKIIQTYLISKRC